MAGAASSILLEPGCLYVTTTQLSMSNLKFHWALIEATPCGAIRHHWHERPNTRTGLAEGYGVQHIQPKSLTGRVVLGYFKIRGYKAPSPDTFTDICASAFSRSYETVQSNRAHGLTCRTWVLHVLSTLCARGYIGYQGTIRQFVEYLERVITEQSRLADNSQVIWHLFNPQLIS
ncbi:hypothetical protein C8R46DRAFT_1063222 [Mycena filopes]|nr:hypothetical protein C8R46DRAFT_1063222 [Mycena filopes]